MQNARPMEEDTLTAGDLCDEAQYIYSELLEPHYATFPEKLTKAESRKFDYIQKILRQINEIQALTLYIAMTQISDRAADDILPFHKCELLNDQELYRDICLRDETSSMIYRKIHSLRIKVKNHMMDW